MRRNVEQMHETLDDLGDWLGDIGKRDAKLRGKADTSSGRDGAGDDGTDEEEEAREIEAAKEELRRLSEVQDAAAAASSSSSAAAAAPTGGAAAAGSPAAAAAGKSKKLTHAQRYGQWEEFDADGIVKDMESRDADRERLRKEVVRLENARAQAKARKAAAVAEVASDALKAQGNAAFGAARYEEAVGLYTDALSHTPRSATLYANRALALLKLGAHEEAAEDCDAALLVEPAHAKALFRRAQARQAQGKHDAALTDLEAALEIEPKDKKAREAMAECRRLRKAAEPKPKPRLQRAVIEEVAHDPDNDEDDFVLAAVPAAAPPAAPAQAAAEAQAGAATAADDGGASSGGGPSSAVAPAAKASPGGGAARPLATAPSPTASSLGLPRTLADLERAFRTLRRSAAEFGTYLRRLEPAALGSLIKHNLPADLFSATLAAIDASYFPEHAAAAAASLREMSGAGRFSIMLMCCDKADTKALASIFEQLGAAQKEGALDAALDLKALRKVYT